MNPAAASAPNWFEKIATRPQRAIVLFSLALLLAGNWILPLTDRDEARFGEASREMLQRGDYVVPWFNGAWRLDKPALIYWCQIASYNVFGDNPFGARLPSVLFTTGTALLLVRWGKKITGDNKTALIAGAMFVAGLHVAIIGRVATADMALVFFCALAAWSGWELTRPDASLTPSPRPSGERAGVRGFELEHKSSSSPLPSSPSDGGEGEIQSCDKTRRCWWWVFYVALGLGFLAKGPIAWLPLGGILLGRALRKDSFRLPLIETLIGLGLTLAIVAAWGLPAMGQTNNAFLKIGLGEHVLNRSVGVIDSHGMKGTLGFLALVPLYFVTFFVSFFPWSTRVPSALRRWWPERKRDDLGWYLLVQAALVFAVFSLVRTKLPHYTMPAFPCLALWFARQISKEADAFVWFSKRILAMTIFIFALTFVGFSVARNNFLTTKLWNATQSYVQPQTKIGCFGYTESSLVWEFRKVATNRIVLGDLKVAKNFLTNTPPFILVLPTKNLADLPDTNGFLISVRGLDMVKLKHWDLTAIVRP
jgi:4-amino-4-deoxy-L-arabinose transferase-like glycosyltransferase